MQYLWLALLVLSVVIETAMMKKLFLFFIPSALVAMFLAFFSVEAWVQVGVFFLLSGIGLLVFLPLDRRLAQRRTSKVFTVESAIGMRCRVIERMDNLAGRGAVSVYGMEWAARTISDEIVIEEGATVEIIAVEGVKFICRAVG